MSSVPYPRTVAIALAVSAMAIAAFFFMRPVSIASAGTTTVLDSPLQQDGLSPDVALTINAIQNEAGISAWFNAGAPVNLDTVAARYRTIEMRTATYIIGSAAVPDYEERHDVHVYIHKDGWFLAYYLKTDPAAKMVDIGHYPAEGTRTKFEVVLREFADHASVPYQTPKFWDFRYPNANRIMVVAEGESEGNSFTIKLPAAYLFFERSFTMNQDSGLRLNEVVIGNCGDSCEGNLTVTQLAVDVTHSLRVTDPWVGENAAAALVLTYRQP